MKASLVYFIAALLFTLFLSFIDEGYYNFRFLESIGNLLVLSVYLLVFWAAQLLIDRIQVNLLPGAAVSLRRALAVVLGLLIPIMVIMLSFSRTALD